MFLTTGGRRPIPILPRGTNWVSRQVTGATSTRTTQLAPGLSVGIPGPGGDDPGTVDGRVGRDVPLQLCVGES